MISVREAIAFFIPSYLTRGRGDIVGNDSTEVSYVPNPNTELHRLVTNFATIHTALASEVTVQVETEPGADEMQPEVAIQDPNETLNKLLGNLTCSLALDLDIAQPNEDIHSEDVRIPFLRHVLSQIGYLDGVDFCEGNNVSFDYKYLRANGPQEIREALIDEIFKGDLDKYWSVFVEKVISSSRILYRQLIESGRKGGAQIDTGELISYLTEPAGEYTEDNSSSAREILSSEKSKITLLGNGQRDFCETLKALNERQAGELHPADQALIDILNELRINPAQSNHMLQALFKLHEVDEINALERPNKLMLDLGEIEHTVEEIARQVSLMPASDMPVTDDLFDATDFELTNSRTGAFTSNGNDLVATAEYAPTVSATDDQKTVLFDAQPDLPPTGEYFSATPATAEAGRVLFDVDPNLQPTAEYRVTPESICFQARENTISTAKLILEREKRRIDFIRKEREAEIKRIRDERSKKRRSSIIRGTVFTTGALALLGTAGAYYYHVSSQSFNTAVSRIASDINPVIKINYEKIYNNALIEMGTEYPPEALEPVVISQYDLQMNNFAEFKNSLNKKYCKILAAYLTPDLPQATIDGIQSGAIRDLPADLRTNFPHDLRNLFTKEEWYYPYDGPHEEHRICYGQMIGQGFTQKGVVQPGVLELLRVTGALVTFLHPRFPSHTRPFKDDPVTHQRVWLDELVEPKPEKELFGGVEPGDFIENDFKLYVDPCNEMLRRIEAKREEIINGFNESSEVQEANALLSNLSRSKDLIAVEKQLSGLALTVKQKQEELEPVLKAIARCECRLKEIKVKLQDRFNTIKQRNSYRAISAPTN